MNLKAQLKTAVEEAAAALGAPHGPTTLDVAIQETPPSKPGDYGTPAAFQLAKLLGQHPAHIAQQLAQTVKLPSGLPAPRPPAPF